MKTSDSRKFSFYVQKYFSAFMAKQRGCSKHTMSSYSTTFSLFVSFTGPNVVREMPITDFKKDDVLRFINWLREEMKCSDSTCNTRLAHFKSFSHFLMREEPMVIDECSKIIAIPFKKVERKPPQSLDEGAISALLAAPGTKGRAELRHSAILAVLYDSGCRVDELIGLNLKDVVISSHSTIHVRGKGNKERDIPILPRTAKLLKSYIDRFRITDPNMILFSSKNGGRMTRQGVNYILKKYINKVKKENPGLIPERLSVHAHILRHSKATHLVNNNTNIFHVRDFLGHNSIQTTQVYLTSNAERMRASIEMAADNIGIPKASWYRKNECDEFEDYLNSLKL